MDDMPFTPIIVPQYTPPPRCPSCSNLESTKTICRHCGYEYKDTGSAWGIWVILFWTLVAGWVMFTLLAWLVPASVGDNITLLSVLKAQWKFLNHLRLY